MMNNMSTLNDRIKNRLNNFRLVPSERSGKLVIWNSSLLDEVEKIIDQEIYSLCLNLRCQIDSLNIVHPEKDKCPECERFREYGRALEYVLKRLGENKK